MSQEYPLVQCEPDDPNRCQASAGHKGQCGYLAIPGLKMCRIHATASIPAMERKAIYQVKVQQWRTRLEELGKHDGLRTLTEEIGVMRLMLEQRLNTCATTEDLLREGHALMGITQTIERLVVSSHKLEKSLGNLLDKTTAIQFSMEVVAIITRHLTRTISDISALDVIDRTDERITNMFQHDLVDAVTRDIEQAITKLEPRGSDDDKI